MSGWDALDQFLQTDPQDVGCDQAMELLDIYVDAMITEGTAATEARYPGLAAHLHACGPCGEDFAGLLALIQRNNTAFLAEVIYAPAYCRLIRRPTGRRPGSLRTSGNAPG